MTLIGPKRTIDLSLIIEISLNCTSMYTRTIFSAIEGIHACFPSPCGPNAECRVIENEPVCSCKPEYIGNPMKGCYHECEFDSQCGHQLGCIDHRCVNPCSTCGKFAICDGVENHKPLCKCPRFYHGNPFVACKPECTKDDQCPPSKPACVANRCRNPCYNACGIHANCTLSGIQPVCSCAEHLTGNPLELCRPWEKRDFCTPNPCKANEKCELGTDLITKKYIPVCSCIAGFYDHGNNICEEGECHEHEHCPDHKACSKHRCVDPCIEQCGTGAVCEAKEHTAVCSCPRGTFGNPTVACKKNAKKL